MCVYASSVYSQQQAQFTQYMYNTLKVNPAYAGTGQPIEASIIHRSQWVGMDGAPRTQNLGVHGAIGKVIGLGLNVLNDRIGPSNQLLANAAISARLKLTNKVSLSIGLSGGMDMVNVDWSRGNSQSQNDPSMYNNINNRVRPVLGAGVYLYARKWYFGLSSPSFITRDEYNRSGEVPIHNRMHFYGIAGYVFDIGSNFKLKPAVLAKMVNGAPVTVDVSLNAMIKDQFTIGLGYRSNDALAILLGYTFKNSFFLGYSYDINLSKLRHFNSGSHDIILKYSLFKKNVEARSPRFF